MNNAMTQLQEIALRIREMRNILGHSIADMAEKTQVSAEVVSVFHLDQLDDRDYGIIRQSFAGGCKVNAHDVI